MGTAETMIILPQALACYSLPARRRLVSSSTSDNEAKSPVSICKLQSVLSNSLTELSSLRHEGRRYRVTPSVGRSLNESSILKVPSQTDMWECIRTHYQYLMEDDLIAACKKTREEMAWMYCDVPNSSAITCLWTCTEFIKKFNELHDALHALHTACVEEKDKSRFVQNHQTTLQALWNEWKVYKEQAVVLERKYPCMKDDISRRCNILGNKWEVLELAIWPKKQEQRESFSHKVLCQMKHVRRWLAEVDSKLTALTANKEWTGEEILKAYNSQKVLQQEIETRGREVTSLIRQVELLGQATTAEIRLSRAARNLERSWHGLWLRSLENQCLTELLLKEDTESKSKPIADSSDVDSDEGPRKKHRRLIYDYGQGRLSPRITAMEPCSVFLDCKFRRSDAVENGTRHSRGTRTVECTRDVGVHCTPRKDMQTNDKCIMVGTTGIAALKAKYGDDFSNFEIIQDVGYSSESSTHLSSDDVSENIKVYSYSPPRRDTNSFTLSSALNIKNEFAKLSELGSVQKGFGYHSLGSSSSASHNDSGFGTVDSSLFCEGDDAVAVEQGDNQQGNEWMSGATSSDCTEEEEDVLDFHLSFSDLQDDKKTTDLASVGGPAVSDGFNSDASVDDYCKMTSLTADAQLYYKMTSVDSESGGCDFADNEMREHRREEKETGTIVESSKIDSLNANKDEPDSNKKVDVNAHVSSEYIQCLSSSTGKDFKPFLINDSTNELSQNRSACGDSEESETSDCLYEDTFVRNIKFSSSPMHSFMKHQQNRSRSSNSYSYCSRHRRKKTLTGKSASEGGLNSATWKRCCFGHLEDCLKHSTRNYYASYAHNIHDCYHCAGIDSSGDASSEYTTTESDGNGFWSSSSEDNCESYSRSRARARSFRAKLKVAYETLDKLSGKISFERTLLLPPPPPPSPPKEGSSSDESDTAYWNRSSDQDRRNNFVTEKSAGELIKTSACSQSSNSVTANERSSQYPESVPRSIVNASYASSDSSVAENTSPQCTSDKLMTRSLPSVFLSDSFQSSNSEHCHSYPASNAKRFPSDKLKKKARRNRRRKRRSSSSCRSSVDANTRKRHWSQTQQQNPKDDESATDAVTETVEDRARILSSPVSDGVLANVEEQSTVSDQVWDGYQEPPYLSEAYSEPTVDEDAVRKLTEFGDDYGSVIGNSLRFHPDFTRRLLRIRHTMQTMDKKIPAAVGLKQLGAPLDSDSDAEDLYDILEDTFKALQFARSSFAYNSSPSEADYAELLATCQTHLQCLRTIDQHIQADAHKKQFTETDLESLHVLINEWAMLQEEIGTSQVNSVEEDIISLQKKICDFLLLKKFNSEDVVSYKDLRKKMDEMQVALSSLTHIKDNDLLAVNLRVHRIVTETGSLRSPLKEDIVKLYKLWEDVYDENANHLSNLQDLYVKWNDYQSHFDELCSKIRDLNSSCGDHLVVSEEAIERLRTQLKDLRSEAQVSFGNEFFKTLQCDLRELEKKLFPEKLITDDECSSLTDDDEENSASRSSCRPKSSQEVGEEDEVYRDAVDSPAAEQPEGGDQNVTEPQPKKGPSSPSKLWRIFRAALPFQIAFALLCCLACALEPHCCDFLNSLNLSVMPQLRHVRGPPPV